MSYPYWPNQSGTIQYLGLSTNVLSIIPGNSVVLPGLGPDGEYSTITASTITTGEAFMSYLDLDGQVLTANASELLLNGIPLATTSNISSLTDWSLDPAISTVNMSGNDLISTNRGYFQSINADSAVFRDVSTTTLTAFSTIHVVSTISSATFEASLGTFSTLNAGTANAGYVSTGTLSASNVNTPNINGGPTSNIASAWSFFQAQHDVDLAGNKLFGGSGPTTDLQLVGSRYITETAQGYSNVVDGGSDVGTNSFIRLQAQNGNRGEISLTANAGDLGVQGEIHLVANGGITPLDVGLGGLVTISANSPVGLTLSNLPSAIKMDAAGINIYAGAIPSVGSVAGYLFQYGMAGVSICSGLPASGFQFPGTTYLYGIGSPGYGGVRMDSPAGVELINNTDLYAYRIYPYYNGFAIGTQPDLTITGRSNLVGNNQYLNLSSIRAVEFGFNETKGVINGLSSINGQNLGAITAPSWSIYPAQSTITWMPFGDNTIQSSGDGTNPLTLKASETNIVALTSVSSINGQPLSFYEPGGVSTISTFTSLNTSSFSVSSISARDGIQINVENSMWFSTSLTLDGGGSGSGLDGGTLGNWKEIDVGSAFVDTVGTLGASVVTFQQPIDVPSVALSTITSQTSSIGIFNADLASIALDTTGDIITVGTRYINTQAQNGLGSLATHLMSGNGYIQTTANQFITSQTPVFTVNDYSGASNNSFVVDQGTSTILQKAAVGIELNAPSTLVTQGSLQLGVSTVMTADVGYAEVGFFNTQNQSTSQIRASGLAIQSYTGDPNFGFYTRLADNRAAYADSNFSTNRLAYTIDSNLDVSSFTVSSINGFSYAPTQDWAMYTANTNVNVGGYNITGVDNVTATTGTMSNLSVSTINGVPYPTASIAAANSLSTQTVLAANTPLALDLGSLGINIGGWSLGGDKLTVPADGYYQLTPSIQFDTTSNQLENVDFWITKNGVDVPNSASKVSVVKNGQQIGTVVVFDKANAGDLYGISIASSDTAMTAVSYAATTSPYTRPDIPSIIFNIQQIAPP